MITGPKSRGKSIRTKLWSKIKTIKYMRKTTLEAH